MAPDSQTSAHRFYLIASIAITVAILYWARELLIPVALAVFLSFLLAPLATRLERAGLGKIPGSLVSVALAFIIILSLGFVITDQLISLAKRLPEYEDNIRAKVQSVQQASAGVVGRTSRSLRGITEPLATQTSTSPESGAAGQPLETEIARRMHGGGFLDTFEPVPSAGPNAARADSEEPIPVRIVEPPGDPLSYIASSVTGLLGTLGTAGLVIVLAIFILIQRRDLRDRLITLTGRGQIFVTTQAFDEMSRRISRYLLMQLVVNASYAIPVTVGLALFGIPNALLWGLMGLVLRFIPYVGAWFTAAVSVLLAIAVFPGWWGAIGVLIFFVVLELFVNNVIEPWLYSVGTGISVLGVIFSAVFWAWIWGPVGLILATPIAVCLTVIGKYIPRLEFLDILLGGRATLEPKLRFFQRLLAMDEDEAAEIAEQHRKSRTLLSVYDDLIVPALQLTEQERHSGQIDERTEAYLNRAFREIIDDCAENDVADRAALPAEAVGGNGGTPAPEPESAAAIPLSLAQSVKIMCLPAGDEADELTALMLEHLLRAQGFQVQTAAVESLSSELLAEVESSEARIVFISALPPGALIAARYLCKRVSSRWPKIPVIVGLWNATGNVNFARERLESCGNSKVVTSYAEALVEASRAAQSLKFAA
jgi:predicted PurR-regulated permease PerM